MDTEKETLLLYIESLLPRGFSISYEDYSIIERWWALGEADLPRILLVLAEILPSYFQQKKSRMMALQGVEKKISQALLRHL